MLENLSQYKLILASASPRRKELLKGLEVDFEVRLIENIDESYPSTLQGEAIPLAIAKKKTAAYLPTLAENELLLTADTIVWIDGKVLGKPKDEADAIATLTHLSGKKHQVITGVCLSTQKKERSFTVVSSVLFASLTAEEIAYYVNKYKPFDKAGGYGIQEWIGYIGVEAIEGSYFNVMGLPIQRLYQELKQF